MLAQQVSALDARISVAVQDYAQATGALQAVRQQIRENRRLQVLARRQIDIARVALAERAVAMYKHDVVTPLDALLSADDFSQLVTQLSMVRRVERSDHDVLLTVENTSRELADRAQALTADESTAERLVSQRTGELTRIRAELRQRRGLLAGVRAQIKRLASQQMRSTPTPGPTVEPPSQQGGGQGPWWPLIQQAAGARGVSARGMYRLMMIESGGSATIVGPGGYYGLFQYAPSTWKGSWNPYRHSSITDGSAQIRATALALRLGYGHAWWDPSYSWAFGGN